MIFLIGKMFVYLLAALGLGAAAGWLWRHQQAMAREAEMERQLMDTRSRFPQVETALRTREQQIEGLLAEVHARDEALAEQSALVAERDRSVADLERSCAELRQRLESLQAVTPEAAAAEDPEELELHPGDPAAAETPPAALTEPEPRRPAAEDPSAPPVAAPAAAPAAAPTPPSEAASPSPADEEERRRLEEALEAANRELERSRSALAVEQRRVAELSQERALQHRALAALEQQLEMVRDDSRSASG